MALIANIEFSNTENQRFDFSGNVIRAFGNVAVPRAGTADRPPAENGLLRYNYSTNRYEGVENNVWVDLRSSDSTVIPVGNTLPNGMFQLRSSQDIVNFKQGTNITIEVEEDALGDRTNVTISASVTGGDVGPVFAHANAAHASANAALQHSNLAFDAANAAFAVANTGAGVGPAFARANAAIQHSNLAFDAANAAFGKTNTVVHVHANQAFAAANASFAHANSGHTHANLSFAAANAAFAHANSGHTHANLAFAMANGANLLSVGEILGNDAFFVRSTRKRLAFKAGSNMTITYGDDSVDDKINVTFAATAGGPGADVGPVFAHANAAHASANAALQHSNLSFAAANAAFAHANSAHTHANQAFAAANSASGAPVGASYLVLGLSTPLTAERVLVPSTGLGVVDGGANGNYTITVAFATQAEQEAGSSTTVSVSPGRQHFHPSACKAWVRFNAAGSMAASYNMNSITDSGVGDWVANISTDFSSGSYCGVGLSGVAGGTRGTFGLDAASAAGTFNIGQVDTYTGDREDPSPDEIHVAFFGDHA